MLALLRTRRVAVQVLGYIRTHDEQAHRLQLLLQGQVLQRAQAVREPRHALVHLLAHVLDLDIFVLKLHCFNGSGSHNQVVVVTCCLALIKKKFDGKLGTTTHAPSGAFHHQAEQVLIGITLFKQFIGIHI